MSVIKHALALAASGIPVFPCKSNKRPAVEGGFKSASTDPATIERMFLNPMAALIGMPTGPASGIDVLDIDPKNGGNDWLEEYGMKLPNTYFLETRSSGRHFYFAHTPGMRNSVSRIAPGVDIRGDGGYVIRWDQHGFKAFGDRAKVAAFPDLLIIAALRPVNPNTPAMNAAELAPPDFETFLQFINDMPNPASAMRDEYAKVMLAIQGCIRGLVALNKPVDMGAIYDAAASWAEKWKGDNPSDFETERRKWDNDWSECKDDWAGWPQLVGFGRKFGMKTEAHELAMAQAEFRAEPPLDGEDDAPAVPAEPLAAGVPDQPAVNENTEDALARGFAADMKGTLLFDKSVGEWFIWSEKKGLWVRDDESFGFTKVREYVTQVRALFGGTDKTLASLSTFRAVESLAKTDPRLSTTSSKWDTDPWLLGVPGGVVDLRTGVMSPGDPAMRITKQTKIAPAAPGTRAPIWEAFLLSATGGDKDLIRYHQKMLGYMLTGDVREEMLPFAYGNGGNGKGTLYGTAAIIFGGYYVQMPSDTFAAKTKTKGEYARATMAGARLVMASETERGSVWDEAVLKELTGNEGMISAREIFGKMFNYKGQFKILITGNYAPELRGASKAMERRLRVIPFNHPPKVVDKQLKEKLIAEYPAILRWMIDGCLRWQKEGLGMCDAVAEASREYFEGQDVLNVWVAERLTFGNGLRMKRSDLFADFAQWSRANGEPAPQAKEFYESARHTLGLVPTKQNGTRMLVGAALQPDEAPSEFSPVADAEFVKSILH